MTPPPAMTTSALSMALGSMPDLAFGLPMVAPDLEQQLEGCERRDVALVEGGRHLHEVEAHHLRARGGSDQQVQGLPGREAARGRNLGAGREGGIENVYVE